MDKENQYGNWLRASFPRSPNKKFKNGREDEKPEREGYREQNLEEEVGIQQYPLLTYTKEFHSASGKSGTSNVGGDAQNGVARRGKVGGFEERQEIIGVEESKAEPYTQEEVKEITKKDRGGGIQRYKVIEVENVKKGEGSKDIMCVDGESNSSFEGGIVGKMRGEKVKETNYACKTTKTSTRDHRTSKTWKRLVQDVSRR